MMSVVSSLLPSYNCAHLTLPPAVAVAGFMACGPTVAKSVGDFPWKDPAASVKASAMQCGGGTSAW